MDDQEAPLAFPPKRVRFLPVTQAHAIRQLADFLNKCRVAMSKDFYV
jgi:hypothetical protein